MSLDPSGLQSAIETFLGSARPSPAAAATAFATVYDDYAQDAQFGASAPTLTGRKALFEAALLGALPGTPASLAAAVAAYWAPTPPIPVVGPQVGTVVGCPGAAGVAAAMAAMFPGPNTRAVAAATTASALHAATQTVTAAVTPPPGTTVPIT